jgi:hypothetical protein
LYCYFVEGLQFDQGWDRCIHHAATALIRLLGVDQRPSREAINVRREEAINVNVGRVNVRREEAINVNVGRVNVRQEEAIKRGDQRQRPPSQRPSKRGDQRPPRR